MNAPADLLVDHRNCDSLDNRKANLRFASHTENGQNRRKRKNATSRFLGVWWDKSKGLWESRIVYNKKRIFLGYFDSEIEAAKAYDEAAKKYFGEFARLNFPYRSEGPRDMPACLPRLSQQFVGRGHALGRGPRNRGPSLQDSSVS
jgi:hypothetical protein